MDKKILGSAHIANCEIGVRLIVLYDDNSCENLFVYDKSIPLGCHNRVGAGRITRKTRSKAIDKLKQMRDEGKIIGYIPGEESN